MTSNVIRQRTRSQKEKYRHWCNLDYDDGGGDSGEVRPSRRSALKNEKKLTKRRV